MAAPPTGRPVTPTVRTAFRFQVEPPPPRPPKISVAVTVAWTVVSLVRIIFGVVYFHDCPQQPNIPNFLLGLALERLLVMPFVILPCESNAAQQREHPKGFKACLGCSLCISCFLWILAGDIWVFSVYQPNYDPTAADGLYCDKTLYTFAFWNAVWETFKFWVIMAKCCMRLMCAVLMSPAPANRDNRQTENV